MKDYPFIDVIQGKETALTKPKNLEWATDEVQEQAFDNLWAELDARQRERVAVTVNPPKPVPLEGWEPSRNRISFECVAEARVSNLTNEELIRIWDAANDCLAVVDMAALGPIGGVIADYLEGIIGTMSKD